VNPSVTTTPIFELGGLTDGLATLQAQAAATDFPFLNEYGTPISLSDQLMTAAPQMNAVFSYAKGLNSGFLGPFSPILDAVLFFVLIVFLITALTFAIPLIGMLVGLARKLWEALPFV